MKRAVCGALIVSFAVGGLHVFASWESVAPDGSDWLLTNVSSMGIGLLAITMLFNVLYLIFDAVRRLFGHGKGERSGLGAAAAFWSIVFVVVMAAAGAGEAMRHEAYRAITVRGTPLLAAINQYQTKHGKPPADLDALVPEFIAAIPDTGVGAYPAYEFFTNSSPVKYAGNPWILLVDVSSDSLTRDTLVYYPQQNYPSSQRGAYVAKFGDWALLSSARATDSK